MDTKEQTGPAAGEEQRIWCWRYEQLVGAGYGRVDAAAIAGTPGVDLALARRLVAQGCPAELATRILL